MNLFDLEIGARDYEGEAAESGRRLAGLGVTEDHRMPQRAPAPEPAMVDPTAGLLSAQPVMPKTRGEQEYEDNPVAATLKKMLIPRPIYQSMYGRNSEYTQDLAKYKVDSEVWKEEEKYRREQARLRQSLAGIDLNEPTLYGIATATDVNDKLGNYLTNTLIGNRNGSTWVADQARKAGLTYTEFLGLDEKARNALIYQNSDKEGRAQLDWIAGRQTGAQKASDAGAIVKAQEEARQEVLEDTTARQQSPQMQVAFDTLNDVLNKGDYHSIYGTVDSETPTFLQSSQNAQTQIEKISAILYMFARGELKGQGQVTEDEAKWAMKSRSSLLDFKQGDEAARAEMMLIQRQLGEKLGVEESEYYTTDLTLDDILDKYPE